MITVYKYNELGHADHGWLNARHHFSFARYWNPQRTQFGALRVINDDIVAAGKGFGAHPHDNMEIITYVREGAISHKDSLGNEGRTGAGDVQVMSAGTGVFHSEYNMEEEDTRLYQIWIEPSTRDVAPRWEAKAFPQSQVKDALTVLVSGQKAHEGTGALFIYQNAAIYGGKLAKDTRITQGIKHQGYILVSNGKLTVNGHEVAAGDGAEVQETRELVIHALEDAEILVIDVPAA